MHVVAVGCARRDSSGGTAVESVTPPPADVASSATTAAPPKAMDDGGCTDAVACGLVQRESIASALRAWLAEDSRYSIAFQWRADVIAEGPIEGRGLELTFTAVPSCLKPKSQWSSNFATQYFLSPLWFGRKRVLKMEIPIWKSTPRVEAGQTVIARAVRTGALPVVVSFEPPSDSETRAEIRMKAATNAASSKIEIDAATLIHSRSGAKLDICRP